MTNEKSVLIYASFIDSAPLIGTLYYSLLRGKEVYSFEFSDKWLSNHSNLILDPDLYNTRGRQFVPSNKKIFGSFSDCAPDRWGRTLLKRREAIIANKENREPSTFYEIDYILGVSDESRMGAFRFKYDNDSGFISIENELSVPPIESLRKLEHASLEFEKSNNPLETKWLNLLLQPGSSLGGARPKATVKDTDDSLWIAKFPSKNDEYNTGAWELTVNQLALLCGLNVAKFDARTFTKKGTTFLSKRFDRTYKGDSVKRIHYASAMTLLGKTDGDSASSGVSYLDIADFIKSNSIHAQKDLMELWKRILFNVLVSNTDDHLRNHGFLLDSDGWSLAPLFDVNPNPDGKFLSLNISSDDNSKDIKLIIETAKFYGISLFNAQDEAEKMKTIIVNKWEQLAKQNGISQTEVELMKKAFSCSYE